MGRSEERCKYLAVSVILFDDLNNPTERGIKILLYYSYKGRGFSGQDGLLPIGLGLFLVVQLERGK